MDTNETPMQAFDAAVEKAGGIVALLLRIDVSHSAPSMWRARKRVGEGPSTT